MKNLAKNANNAPKLYCVCIEQQNDDGNVITRPLRGTLTPGGFPDGSTTRFQAKKLLDKARARWPQARLASHRAL